MTTKSRRATSGNSKSKPARSASSGKGWEAFTHRVDLYARRVLGDASAGELLVAGPLVRLTCERHLRDRAAAAVKCGHPGGWSFSAEKADLGIDFYQNVLRLPDTVDADGEPKPFILEPPLAFIIGSGLGWIGADGYRRFREIYVEMGKGNGKTPTIAGLGLYGLLLDQEHAAEIYPAAVTRDQAKILFRDAERMALCSPDLAGLLTRTVNNLSYELSFMRPYSRDQGMRSGPRPHMALIDEVHEHPSPELINKLKAGFKYRKQPIIVYITNSGFDRTSICWQLRQHAERVINGSVTDDRFFAYVCALDDGDNPLEDEACWPKANPLLGVTITHEYLRRQVANARNIPSELNTVLRLNFCVWTQAHTRAIDMAQWNACPVLPSDEELAGHPCFGGLDLGQTDDLSAWVRIWDLLDGRLAVKARFWIPQSAREKYKDRPYDVWIGKGLLEVTDGNTTDYDVIEQAVLEDCQRDGVREVSYDKRFAEQMAQHLLGAGVIMVDQPQGFQLNEAIRKKLTLIAEAALCHGNNEILNVMASNYVLRHGTKGEVRPDKDKASEKIDGQVALDMAIARWVRQPVIPPWNGEIKSLGDYL